MGGSQLINQSMYIESEPSSHLPEAEEPYF